MDGMVIGSHAECSVFQDGNDGGGNEGIPSGFGVGDNMGTGISEEYLDVCGSTRGGGNEIGPGILGVWGNMGGHFNECGSEFVGVRCRTSD